MYQQQLLPLTQQWLLHHSQVIVLYLPGTDVDFSVTATGTGLTYQWQVSTDNGSTWTNIEGAIGCFKFNICFFKCSISSNCFRKYGFVMLLLVM